MKSVMSHNFSQVPQAEIQRSSFDRSHSVKTTFNGGELIPVFVDEALPGDTFKLNMAMFARLATPIVPFMDNLFLDSFFFAVPNRLVWDNWEKFNGQQTNPGDSTDFLIPQVAMPPSVGAAVGSLSDYLGIPTGIADLPVSALWHRAYNLIWNEWFRDQNLQNSLTVPTNDGPDTYSNYTVKRRGKRHDYFTSCLPWPQKGPAVPLPLGTTAPIYRTNNAPGRWRVMDPTTNSTRNSLGSVTGTDGSGNWQLGGPTGFFNVDPNGSLYTDLSAATASTINALRQAFQVQRLYERDARGGTRYTEIIRAHFGVTSPDARLQRPEYLGGNSTPINIHPIEQTSSTDATSPQGNLAAMGTVSSVGAGFTKSFTEHTLLIGLVSVRADLNYQQGLNRMWSRRTRFDYYWPALAHIGEQTVLNKEIYATTNTTQNNTAFGYQERYAEYRYKPSIITGKFRSQAADSLDVWHLAQNFGALPALNSTFIEDNPPIDRVVATPDEPDFLFDAYFKMNCARPMPLYSVPGLIDHF